MGEIELAWEERGAGEPLLLIMGVGAQRALWPEGFVEALAARGYRVILFDNRDVGESTWLEDAPVFPLSQMIPARLFGRELPGSYTLSDMATDSARLLAALGIERAHVVGLSMGGMIAQHLAMEHPGCVGTLTSIMSSPGHLAGLFGYPAAMKALLTPAPDRSREATVERAVSFFSVVSGTLPSDVEGTRERAGLQWDRGDNRAGVARQFAAIMASGSRRERLHTITAPTLVIHGTHDPLVLPRSGRATADAIPGSTWLPIEGMGHELAPASWAPIIDAIHQHTSSTPLT